MPAWKLVAACVQRPRGSRRECGRPRAQPAGEASFWGRRSLDWCPTRARSSRASQGCFCYFSASENNIPSYESCFSRLTVKHKRSSRGRHYNKITRSDDAKWESEIISLPPGSVSLALPPGWMWAFLSPHPSNPHRELNYRSPSW